MLRWLMRYFGLAGSSVLELKTWNEFFDRLKGYGCTNVVAQMCINKGGFGHKTSLWMLYRAQVNGGVIIQYLDRAQVSEQDIAVFPEAIEAEMMLLSGRINRRRRDLHKWNNEAKLTAHDPRGRVYGHTSLREAASVESRVRQRVPLRRAFEEAA